MRLYPLRLERKEGRARLHKASQGPWLLAKCTLYPEEWLFVHRARGLSCQWSTWTPRVLWSNNCTENTSIISHRPICVRHSLYITLSCLPTQKGRNDALPFMKEKKDSKRPIKDSNPGDFGCLSVDRCPGTCQVTVQRLKTSCHTKLQ